MNEDELELSPQEQNYKNIVTVLVNNMLSGNIIPLNSKQLDGFTLEDVVGNIFNGISRGITSGGLHEFTESIDSEDVTHLQCLLTEDFTELYTLSVSDRLKFFKIDSIIVDDIIEIPYRLPDFELHYEEINNKHYLRFKKTDFNHLPINMFIDKIVLVNYSYLDYTKPEVEEAGV